MKKLALIFPFLLFSLFAESLYVTHAGLSQVTVIDTKTDSISTTIAVDAQTFEGAGSPDGRTMYITQRNPDSQIVEINTLTNEIIREIPLPSGLSTDLRYCDQSCWNNYLYSEYW